jgi:formylglycine-generating enzyme required for sulfatase activity
MCRARRPSSFSPCVQIVLILLAIDVATTACRAAGAREGDPFYLKQDTWHTTLIASLEKIAASGLEDALPAFESETLRGSNAPVRVSVPLKGASELYLFLSGSPDNRFAVGDWANATVVKTNGGEEVVSESKNFRVLRGRHELDLALRAGLYQKMSIGGRMFPKGFCVQGDSVLYIPLDADAQRFEAWIGVDDWSGTNGSVRFSVTGARTAARKRLFETLARDFSSGGDRQEMSWEREDRIWEEERRPGDWTGLAKRYAGACWRVGPLKEGATRIAAAARTKAEMEAVRKLYLTSRQLAGDVEAVRSFDFTALSSALQDLEKTFPGKFPPGYLKSLAVLESRVRKSLSGFKASRLADFELVSQLYSRLEALKRESLLANPLLEADRLLVVKRKPIGDPRRSDWDGFGFGEFLGLPRQSSWNNGTMPNVDKWTNEIAVLSPVRSNGAFTTIYRPESPRLVTDVDLHWNAEKLLFSMPDQQKNWQVCELRSDGSGFRQLTPSEHPDVHNYDGTYLPNGEILFLSTAPLQGVPCNASVIVGMMYKMGPNGERIRQLTFEQDHDYTPCVMNNGRVLYLRWDYTDTPHIWNRVLMSMNPDGTGQMEYYGANSYWPNAVFFARPIPKHESKFVGIVTGHHEGRVGDLFVFDPAKGRQELKGVVQRIPRKGPPVQAKIEDKLTEHNWPKFLHPWPLNENYFLVSCKPSPDSLWGIYLVDVFDNAVLIKEEEGFALLEPIPLSARPKPPVIQDRTRPADKDALVYMEDVYSGPGVRGIPRGTIKALRLFTYHFGYQTLAGIDHRVGADGPWEAKRVLGTVPVEDDGSALFTVPAKTPISFQPLDREGKAVALMRSWMTAMPGESVACIGCHDRQSSAPPSANFRLALTRPPSKAVPSLGPSHGFSFVHDVQPVLDKYCVGCHAGEKRVEGKPQPDLRRDQGGYIVYKGGEIDGKFIRGSKQDLLGKYGAVFEPSYVALRQYVRVGKLESDLHLLPPMEFHADTSELVQMLQRGHHNVKLDAEAWDRIITWIDLNAPCHGRWSDVTRIPGNQCARRLELRKLYGGILDNFEEMPEIETDYDLPTPIIPVEPELKCEPVSVPGWPLSHETARRAQASTGTVARSIDLGGGVKIDLVRVPAGEFVMGSIEGEINERPAAAVKVPKTFWIAKCEISNEQYARFDPAHESRFEHRTSWIFSEEYLGWRLDRPRQPVVRVSCNEAEAFCRWLSAKLGEKVSLPTEAQWEYACRAGTDSPLWYGGLDSDFSEYANLGDASLRRLADEGWRPKSPDLVPKESRYNDRNLVTADCASYKPNAWGLFDMHGNAAEWTSTAYRPYPYSFGDGREEPGPEEKRVVRGGSWRDRPKYSRSGSRLAYPPYQKVFNVGFRIAIN